MRLGGAEVVLFAGFGVFEVLVFAFRFGIVEWLPFGECFVEIDLSRLDHRLYVSGQVLPLGGDERVGTKLLGGGEQLRFAAEV